MPESKVTGSYDASIAGIATAGTTTSSLASRMCSPYEGSCRLTPHEGS
jgi:hypothetical protein